MCARVRGALHVIIVLIAAAYELVQHNSQRGGQARSAVQALDLDVVAESQ